MEVIHTIRKILNFQTIFFIQVHGFAQPCLQPPPCSITNRGCRGWKWFLCTIQVLDLARTCLLCLNLAQSKTRVVRGEIEFSRIRAWACLHFQVAQTKTTVRKGKNKYFLWIIYKAKKETNQGCLLMAP